MDADGGNLQRLTNSSLSETTPSRTREPMTYITPDVDVRGEGGFWFDPAGKWGKRLFKDPYPLSESQFLVSMNPTGDPREKINWGLYLLEESGEAKLLHQDAQIGCFMPVHSRPGPSLP